MSPKIATNVPLVTSVLAQVVLDQARRAGDQQFGRVGSIEHERPRAVVPMIPKIRASEDVFTPLGARSPQ